MNGEITYGVIDPAADPDPYSLVLAQAFVDYPVMKNVFAEAIGDRAHWVQRLSRQAIKNRLAMGTPVLAAFCGGVPVGVAVISLPDYETPEGHRAAFNAILSEAGTHAEAFMKSFIEAVDSFEPEGRHIWVGILGVHPGFQGRGIGKRLLEEATSLAETIPDCLGLALDTEDDNNVTIYRACGFEVIGSTIVGEMPVYVMWKPLAKQQDPH